MKIHAIQGVDRGIIDRRVLGGLTRLLSRGLLIAAIGIAPGASAAVWQTGDVFVGVSGGTYKVYTNTGVFKESITDLSGGTTTGAAFNPTLDKLYTTYFAAGKVIAYADAHPHVVMQTIVTGDTSPESIVFAANGDFYVGHADGTRDIQRYNAAGLLQQSYNVGTENRGSDWIDLAADQKTMFYTSEGRKVLRYDLATNTQLADFATVGGVLGTFRLYALRLLPPGDGTGGLLVADTGNIKRLDSAGNLVATYDAPAEDTWFSLNLDPNGTSFWAGNYGSSNFYRFNIASGAVEVGPINTGTAGNTLFGIAVRGELTAALPSDGWMTGGGSVFTAGGDRVTHGFTLQGDKTKGPNQLEVNWGKGNRFKLDVLTSAVVTDDPAIDPKPPTAGFDTYLGKGTGEYNGQPGATAEWTFTDAGEPGKDDVMRIVIRDAANVVVLAVSGKLDRGNHQAHK